MEQRDILVITSIKQQKSLLLTYPNGEGDVRALIVHGFKIFYYP